MFALNLPTLSALSAAYVQQAVLSVWRCCVAAACWRGGEVIRRGHFDDLMLNMGGVIVSTPEPTVVRTRPADREGNVCRRTRLSRPT